MEDEARAWALGEDDHQPACRGQDRFPARRIHALHNNSTAGVAVPLSRGSEPQMSDVATRGSRADEHARIAEQIRKANHPNVIKYLQLCDIDPPLPPHVLDEFACQLLDVIGGAYR